MKILQGMTIMYNKKVLFICGHNSGRSQMAEAFLTAITGDRIHVDSAGLEPRPVNPLVVEVMQEIDYDFSRVIPNSVFDYFKEGRLYNYVITVCDDTAGAQCPVFRGITERQHWPSKDPEDLTGTSEDKLNTLREIRDQIKDKVSACYGR